MKKVVIGLLGFVAAMAFVSNVYATYILTNETKMQGAGASTNTIGGETFPTSYRIMLDYTTPSDGPIDIVAFVKEKNFWLWSSAFTVDYEIPGNAAGGRATRWVSRSGKPTKMFWQKIDTSASYNFVIGAYQY